MLQEIERDHKDLLQFGDEFQGVSEVASKSNIFSVKTHSKFDLPRFFFSLAVDMNELQRVLNEIKGKINIAQTDLDNAKNAPADAASEDRYVEAMEVCCSY